MTSYSIREMKRRPHALLARVRLGKLVRQRLVRRRGRALSRALLAARPVVTSSGASAVDALLAERAGGP